MGDQIHTPKEEKSVTDYVEFKAKIRNIAKDMQNTEDIGKTIAHVCSKRVLFSGSCVVYAPCCCTPIKRFL